MDAKTYKEALLKRLYEPYKNCKACPLGNLGRINVVFGEGNPDAKLMVIGEGPGREEDLQGRPFVGRSGQLLTRIIEKIGASREEIYITNIVKCRPPNNRAPLPIESKTCKSLLLVNQIRIIRPRVICTLGSSALQGLLEREFKITKVRGTPIAWENIQIIPTLHPAYVLRNPKELQTLFNDIQTAYNLSLNTSGG